MSYQVLARKWRPHTFAEMVGQEPVLRMLTNALDNQRLHHAYLFTGTRGVGKTSLGRLLAKCLNCETGITSNPCNTCSTCTAVDAGRFLDLLEIDAASRTKVEDTRELLDNVQYAPTQGRFKIYLIDEVHMLSGHSFNALLKTLEEPPAHVKFILATTDPKRLPVTILSRCLQFNLKRVPVEQLTPHLQHICTAEKINFEMPALEQLAYAADGSVRDALSLLDQAIAFCNANITAVDVLHMLGNVEQDYIFRMLATLADQDGKKLLTEIAALAEQAPDFIRVLENVLSVLHQIAISQVITAAAQPIKTIIQLAARFTAEDIQLYYQIALLGRRDLPLASSPMQGFEMVMLRMLAFKPTTNSTPPEKPKILPEKNPLPIAAPLPTATTTAIPAAEKIITATPVLATGSDWPTIISQLGLTGLAQVLASNTVVEKIDGDSIELALSNKHEAILNKKLSERLTAALSQYYKRDIKLTIHITSADINTSAKQHEQHKKDRLASAVDAITTDTQVKKIMDVFNATLDIQSVKAIDN
jgi:DNA polymerase-3 subunit gamma/tau